MQGFRFLPFFCHQHLISGTVQYSVHVYSVECRPAICSAKYLTKGSFGNLSFYRGPNFCKDFLVSAFKGSAFRKEPQSLLWSRWHESPQVQILLTSRSEATCLLIPTPASTRSSMPSSPSPFVEHFSNSFAGKTLWVYQIASDIIFVQKIRRQQS